MRKAKMHQRIWLAGMSILLLAACEPKQDSMSSVGQELRLPERVAAPAPRKITSSGSYLAGRFAYAQNDMQAAARYMTQTLEFDPDNTDLLRQAFLLMVAQGRQAEYQQLARKIVARYPSDFFANLVLAVEMMQAGDFERSYLYMDAMPNILFQQLLRPLTLSWIYTAEGRQDEALEALRSLERNPDLSSLSLLHQAMVYYAFGDVDDAETLFAQSFDAVEEPPLRLVYLYTRFLHNTGRAERAKQITAAFHEDNPQSLLARYLPSYVTIEKTGFTAKQGLAHAFFDVASLLNQPPSRDIALMYARLAHNLDPEFAFSSIILGDIFLQQQRYDEAINVFSRVQPTSPFYWLSQLQRAQALEELGRTNDAIALLKELEQVDPKLVEVPIELGDLLRRQERFADAIPYYSNAIKRINNNDSNYWSLYYARGIAYERTNQWPLAEQDFKKALELSPNQPYVLNYLAYSWVEKGIRLDEAQNMLLQAIAEKPADGYIVDSYGWVQYKLGHYDEAVRYLERAVELRPFDALINDHLGDAYWQTGRYDEARFQWKRALSFKPSAYVVALIEKKLQNGLDAVEQAQAKPQQ